MIAPDDPAFPNPLDRTRGLTKRECFAAAALTGLMARTPKVTNYSPTLAELAFAMADACLETQNQDAK